MNDIVGILPAAGLGQRLKPYNGPKELLSVGYQPMTIGTETKTMPMVVSQYTLNAMSAAGVENIYFVLSPLKWEIAKFFSNGAAFGVHCGYLFQDTPTGMPGALDSAYPWVYDKLVCMGMPDTIVTPGHCFTQVLDIHSALSADLTLGIFPTDTPQFLAPVHLDPATGRVLEIFDKPATTSYYNTWGIAVWSPVFTTFLHTFVQSALNGEKELLLSDVFSEAIHQDLNVYGHFFSDGKFFDIGTPEGLRYTRSVLEYPYVDRKAI